MKIVNWVLMDAWKRERTRFIMDHDVTLPVTELQGGGEVMPGRNRFAHVEEDKIDTMVRFHFYT